MLCDTLIGSTSSNLLPESLLYLLESINLYLHQWEFDSSVLLIFLKVYILISDICYIESIPPNLLELFKTHEYFNCFSTIMIKPT